MVTFNQIPGSLRTPLFFLEVDPTAAASPSSEVGPALLIGNKLAAGTAAALALVQVQSASQAKTLFGEGSVLFDMVEAYRRNDASSELWVVPFDDGAGIAAEFELTILGTATAAGVIYLYVSGRLIAVDILSGDDPTAIATAIAAAVTAASDMPVTAAFVLGVVTFTTKHSAVFVNDLDIRVNYLGTAGGETLPAGVTSAIVAQTATGTLNPDISGLAAAIGDALFDKIGMPYTDATAFTEIGALLDQVTGRWAWNRQIYGHAFTAAVGSVAALGTLADINDEHITIVGLDSMPSAPWQVTGAVIGRAGQSLDNDPARPLQTLDLIGILAPERSAKFTQGQRNTLLFDGVATMFSNADGIVRIERLITTFQTDAFANASDAYLDIMTLFTLMRFNRRLGSMVTNRWPRYKLADDDTPISEGQTIVTPNIIKGGLIAEYSAMVDLGWVENEALFAASLTVVRSQGDPNRVDVLVEPDLINQLRVFAVQNRFRLQYPQTAL